MGTLPLALVLGLLILAPGQAATDLQATIAQLGSFDFDTRTTAARTLRRAPAPEVVPALEAAARSHVDQYVRFRALVLLSGLDTGAMTRVSTELVGDRNDRVRAVAYQWFEHHPQAAVLPRLLDALPNETSEFVRPALTRALVASGESPDVQRAVRPLVLKGEDMFRGSVIAALGDHRGAYAIEELLAVVALDGPLQDDAITAIGRIGNPSTRSVIAGLQKTVPRELQPTVSAALCLLQVDCPARVRFVIETLGFAAASDQQLPLLRGAVHAAGVLAGAGHGEAFEALIDAAMAAEGAARDAVTLGVGNVILRQPLLALRVFETRQQPAAVAELFRDGFDMLSEDFDKEQFGAEVRRTLWATPEGAVRRQAAASLLDALEF
jgi:hypothetical protein